MRQMMIKYDKDQSGHLDAEELCVLLSDLGEGMPTVEQAKELMASVSLRVHLAGHVASDEDPRWASQRAMAVGGALIALGVLPLQLRAKGYGSKVPISRMEKLRLGLKSLRRVTVHALGEVRTREPIGFESESASLSEGARGLLEHVASRTPRSVRVELPEDRVAEARPGSRAAP